jgi:hypothetical protein
MSRRVSCVTRTLDAIRRYKPAPDQIDIVILAAINVGLCLESNCDRLVAEGFNHDIQWPRFRTVHWRSDDLRGSSKDRRRWPRAGRVAAILIASILTIGMPIAIARTLIKLACRWHGETRWLGRQDFQPG